MLVGDVFHGITAIDKLATELEPSFGNLHGEPPPQTQLTFAGMLSLVAGYSIAQLSGSKTLASGYFTNAARSLRKFGGEGVCQMLHQRMPDFIPAVEESSAPSVITIFKPVPVAPPVLVRNPASASETMTSSDDTSLEDDTSKGENLDTVTYVLPSTIAGPKLINDRLMRSSIALASEQDPQVLMATLLRVLCQYTRADYAAIALADPEDPAAFRLVASGVYEKIAPRDIALGADEAQTHCPANLMLKVALTNKVRLPRKSVSTSTLIP